MNQRDQPLRKRRQTRRRQAEPIIIRFATPVPSNERHPLGNVDPATRNAERQRVIASVLARLAEAAADIPDENGTIGAEIKLFNQTEDEPEAGSQNEAD